MRLMSLALFSLLVPSTGACPMSVSVDAGYSGPVRPKKSKKPKSARDYVARVDLAVKPPAPEDSGDRSELTDPAGAPANLAQGRRAIFFAPLRCREAAAVKELTFAVEFERSRCAALMEGAESVGKAAGFTILDAQLIAGATNPIAAAKEQGAELLFAVSASSGAGPQPASNVSYDVSFRRKDAGGESERMQVSGGAVQRCRHIVSVLMTNDPTIYPQMLRLAFTAVEVESGAAFWEYSSTLAEPTPPDLDGAWFEISTTVGRPTSIKYNDAETIVKADAKAVRRVALGAVLSELLSDRPIAGMVARDVVGAGYAVEDAMEAREPWVEEGPFPSAAEAVCNYDPRVRTSFKQLLEPPPPLEQTDAALDGRREALVEREKARFVAEVDRIRSMGPS